MPARPAARRGTSADFFDVVRHQLADVPWERRQQLLAEVGARLHGLPERARPEDVLGDPRAYAKLVREAAGLPSTRVAPFPYFRALRLRNKVMIIVVPLLVALVGTGLTAMRHYQPLRANANISFSSGPRIDARYATDVDFSGYQRGATVVSGVGLKNTGRATVTVIGILMPEGSPLKLVGLRAQSNPQLTGLWEKARPVHRLAVHPGESVELYLVMKMIQYRFAPGSFSVTGQPQLVVEVLGATHTLQPSGNRIGVVG